MATQDDKGLRAATITSFPRNDIVGDSKIISAVYQLKKGKNTFKKLAMINKVEKSKSFVSHE